MSKVFDVSPKLGEYMLKGWILTDDICARCSRVPLMRSPASPTEYFCANCDSGHATSSQSNASDTSSVPKSQMYEQSSISSASSSHLSRSSTPPTEVSSTVSSPTFAPPLNMEEILRRRQQSDTASAEIGRRMLKGWAMLADECPNTGCYGIPLVRSPKSGGQVDPRKECVICGTIYIDEQGQSGASRLVPLNQPSTQESRSVQSAAVPHPGTSSSIARSTEGKGKAVAVDFHRSTSNTTVQAPPPHYVSPIAPSSSSVLEDSAQSLEHALQALSGRLRALASGPSIETSTIAQTAEAISTVSRALGDVRQLQQREARS